MYAIRSYYAGSSYVTLATNCNSCHSTTVTAGQAFVDAGDNLKHDACTICHAADGTMLNSWTSGDCTQCHSTIDNGTTLDLFAHDIDHDTSNMVNNEVDCAGCHAATVAYPLFTDAVV